MCMFCIVRPIKIFVLFDSSCVWILFLNVSSQPYFGFAFSSWCMFCIAPSKLLFLLAVCVTGSCFRMLAVNLVSHLFFYQDVTSLHRRLGVTEHWLVCVCAWCDLHGQLGIKEHLLICVHAPTDPGETEGPSRGGGVCPKERHHCGGRVCQAGAQGRGQWQRYTSQLLHSDLRQTTHSIVRDEQ